MLPPLAASWHASLAIGEAVGAARVVFEATLDSQPRWGANVDWLTTNNLISAAEHAAASSSRGRDAIAPFARLPFERCRRSPRGGGAGV